MINADGKLEFGIELCPDCMVWFANADDSGVSDPDRFHKGIADVARDMSHHYPNGYLIVPGDGEAFFSHADCDGCDQPLAGDRYDATFIEL